MIGKCAALTTCVALLTVAALLAWAAKPFSHLATAASSPLPGYMPSGAQLYIEAKDFSSLLADWGASPEKQRWLQSDNFEVFSRSRLFLRLADAQREFTAAAGVPPDMTLVSQAAGKESALALYDVGKLEFLYISRVPSADAMQSVLWQARSKFEPRTAAGGAPFFVHTDADSGRVVAFAISGEYLLLATREDLLAASLELLASGGGAKLTGDAWYANAVAAAGDQGDLRMVINMSKISREPHFRSYWIQSNVKEMQQYSAVVSDLYRSGDVYREERVLLRNPEPEAVPASASTSPDAAKNARVLSASPSVTAAPAPGAAASAARPAVAPVRLEEINQAMSDLLRLVPDDAVVYRAVASPTSDDALALLQTKVLAPRIAEVPASKIAPEVVLTGGAVGSSADLETRIDQQPVVRVVAEDGPAALRQSLQSANVEAVLSIDSTHVDSGSSFVEFHSAVVLAAASDWDANLIRTALARTISQAATAQGLGFGWRDAGKSPEDYSELDGLVPLRAAVRGKLLIVSGDAATIASLLSRLQGRAHRDSASSALSYAAGIRYSVERPDFLRLTTALDHASAIGSENFQLAPWQRSSLNANLAADGSREPAFFSGNVAGLSRVFLRLESETVTIRNTAGTTHETVIYNWK